MISLLLIITLCSSTAIAEDGSSFSLTDLLNRRTTPEPKWTGKYFPTPPMTQSTPAPFVQHGGVPMGALNPNCDDGKTNLSVDWNSSPWDYTCLFPSKLIIPDINIQPILDIENVPKEYSAVHYCMNETIVYQNPVPTFGPHRPAWPRYGEYSFVPVQRWLHTLEHGGVVMLYHPCAHPLEVERLKRIVRACLFRHVITPNAHLKADRPLALLTWGNRLTMSAINVDVVKDFIKQNALHGPEKISRDGQYDAGLIREAKIVSDTEDTDLCPPPSLKELSFYW
ncbi:Tumor protein p53-inducible protein 13 [Frankliniella fusca]|uniref:Tumor protein p53-inducible protein 13 n=1 Tax=Frankliniella fusca TaxID=407009 RepID=A0AAE1LIW9_9NEOP|nr:Tumor protein p53-inducible protein 13 [Frankliniella fusca]